MPNNFASRRSIGDAAKDGIGKQNRAHRGITRCEAFGHGHDIGNHSLILACE